MFSYIHIPFCESKCSYCRFASVGSINTYQIEYYVAKLCNEIKSFSSTKELQSIYFGGGTPGLLTHTQVFKIISSMKQKFRFIDHPEITFETTPNMIDINKISQLIDMGINRISMGVQSLHQETLKEIGRGDKGDTIRALSILEESECSNVSIDFIIGLPYVPIGGVQKDIQYLLDRFSCIKHISVYMLEDYYEKESEEESRFQKITYPKNWSQYGITEEDFASEYESVFRFLEKRGFFSYELSNFAQVGYECKHNMGYWNHSPVAAFGLGASGYIDGVRYKNSESFGEYYQGIQQDREYLSEADLSIERLMFGLRTKGIHKNDTEGLKQDSLKRFIEQGYLRWDEEGNYLKRNMKGTVFLDYILSQII